MSCTAGGELSCTAGNVHFLTVAGDELYRTADIGHCHGSRPDAALRAGAPSHRRRR
mgnify:CR=1 FL=1